MREWLTGRNAVYEALRSKRRHFFGMLIQQDLKIEGRLKALVDLAEKLNIPVRVANKQQLGQLDRNHQGLPLKRVLILIKLSKT